MLTTPPSDSDRRDEDTARGRTTETHTAGERAEEKIYAAYRRGDLDAETTVERLAALIPPAPALTAADYEELSRWAQTAAIDTNSSSFFVGDQAAALGRAWLRWAGRPVND